MPRDFSLGHPPSCARRGEQDSMLNDIGLTGADIGTAVRYGRD
jgi:hypothetical protein